jgi:hypothetical protein
MALSVSQILAASYSDVVNEMRKAANQWHESALMREMERQKLIERIPGGPKIEATLDYQRNQNAGFLATDLQPTSTSKTEVLTAAEYDPAQLSIPITWSKADEAKNPETNQKVSLVKALLENGINSHDDLIEEALFQSSTDGFLGLQTIVPDSGQGTVGGINAATELFWRNHSDTYASNGSDIEAKMTEAWNECTKGSGSSMSPSLLASDAETQAIYEATQQDLRRYVDSQQADAGFKILAFKTARYVFSQHGGTRIYFLSKAFKLTVFKSAFRKKGETIELPNAEGYVVKLFSVLQSKTNNKSRLAVLTRT